MERQWSSCRHRVRHVALSATLGYTVDCPLIVLYETPTNSRRKSLLHLAFATSENSNKFTFNLIRFNGANILGCEPIDGVRDVRDVSSNISFLN